MWGMKRRIKKERFLSRIVRSPFTYIILIGVLFLFSYSAINTYKKSKIAKEKTRQVERELAGLLEKEGDLKNSLYDMNTSFGVEKSLREKFGIVKNGEVAIIIIDPVSSEISPQEEKNKGFWGFIRNIF
jgi:cell division protein FtsB